MRKRTYLWGVGIGALLIGSVFLLGLIALAMGGLDGFGSGLRRGVAILELKGPIVDAAEFLEQIEEVREADHVKAVVLRVDSPGGSVGASQEIYHALKRLRAKKPLVASFGAVAASGGYYAGIAAQKIYVLPGTVTASIGVRMTYLNAADLYAWARLKPDILKSGKLKDAGSMYREMLPEERAYFDAFLAEMHGQFKAAVAAERGVTMAQLETIADGRVLTGASAITHGLADAIGDLEDAAKDAWTLAGETGEPKLLRSKRPSPWWWSLLGGSLEASVQRFVRTVIYQATQPEVGYY